MVNLDLVNRRFHFGTNKSVQKHLSAKGQLPRCGAKSGDYVATGTGQCKVDRLGVPWQLSLQPQGNSGAAIDLKLAAAVLKSNKKR